MAYSLRAIQYIRTLRGGLQPSLIRASDGNLYVVKFADTPQGLGRDVRANEVMGSELLRASGLPTPGWKSIYVPPSLRKEHVVETLQVPTTSEQFSDHLYFGSHFLDDDPSIWIFDFLPSSRYSQLVNKRDFLGMFLFDLLCENAHRRKCVFVADRKSRNCRAVFIDNAHLFGSSNQSLYSSSRASLPPFVDAGMWTSPVIEFWISRFEAGIKAGLESLARHPKQLWYKEHLDAVRERLTVRLGECRTLFLNGVHIPDAAEPGACSDKALFLASRSTEF